jgi:hypothetical protein
MARAFHAGHPIPATQAGPLALEPKESVAATPGDTGPISCSILYFPEPMAVSRQTVEVAEELGALLCLASGRRFEVPPELQFRVKGGTEVHFQQFSRGIDRELIGPLPPDTIPRTLALLNRIAVLQDNDVHTLGRALHLYYGACNIVEGDVRSAYIMLVSALEILSREYGSPPKDWNEWEEAAEWDDVFAEIELAPEQSAVLRIRLLNDKHLRLKRTLCDYVANALPGSFWQLAWEQWSYSFRPPTNDWGPADVLRLPRSHVITRDKALLRRALQKTYDARSAYVHRGDTFSIEQSLRSDDIPVNGTAPISYPILRLIVRDLVLLELTRRGGPSPKSSQQ